MNTLHDHDTQPSNPETETSIDKNTSNRRLKVAAAALMFAIPTGMYADNVVDAVQESFELHVDPNVLRNLPAK